jgi:hypothetical protein
MTLQPDGRLAVDRAAPRPARAGQPIGVWIARAKATPVAGADEEAQGLLCAAR